MVTYSIRGGCSHFFVAVFQECGGDGEPDEGLENLDALDVALDDFLLGGGLVV